MHVLIVGAGIAGPTLAYWLQRLGHRPTLVEWAPEPRRGGYLVDFWGAGFDVAERMGIVPELRRSGYHLREARAVGRDGRRIASFEPSAFVGSGDRYVTIARSDLASAILGALEGDVEIDLRRHGGRDRRRRRPGARHVPQRCPAGLRPRGGSRRPALAGARLAFGPQQRFENHLGIVVAAFEVAGYRPRDELVAVMHADVGFQLLRLSLRDDATLFSLTLRDGGNVPLDSPASSRHCCAAGSRTQAGRHRRSSTPWGPPARSTSTA